VKLRKRQGFQLINRVFLEVIQEMLLTGGTRNNVTGGLKKSNPGPALILAIHRCGGATRTLRQAV
jgi:hypothetical protein